MSVWALATDLAIVVLIAGSLAVFAWFLTEVVRLVREEKAAEGRARGRGRRDGR